MHWFQKAVGLGACLFCSSCRLGWAGEEPSLWRAPMVQQVRVAQGIRAGIYYPEHDELVLLKPGAWVEGQEPPKAGVAAELPGAKKDDPGVMITLGGRLKLSAALKLMAQAWHKRLVTGPGVDDPDVALFFEQARVEEALRQMLYPFGYGFNVHEDELLILARDTRVFRLNLPPVTQAFNASTSNESSSAGASNNTGRSPADARLRVGAKVLVEHASGVLSYWNDIEANVKSLVSLAGAVSVNKSAGVVVVTDTPRVLEKIDTFFKDMNARASEQIVVDVKVVEVTLSNEHKLGIDWNALMSAGDLKGVNVATNFASENMTGGNMLTFSGRANKDGSGDSESGVKAVLKALEAFGRIEVVSQPRIMMLNNSVASIQVGETRSYIESTNMETTSGGATITSAALSEVHGGVTLQIIGSIVQKDIFLNVTPVVSTIDDIRSITLGGGNKLEAPETSMKTLSTLVRVAEGRTVAIGGLISHERSRQQYGVPLLSKIPVLGKMFSYGVRRHARTELVIFMTPRRG